MTLGQLVDIIMDNVFRKCFEWLVRLEPNSTPFSIYQLEKQFLNNQVWSFLAFHYFECVESAG